jgi:hypothetical protein
MNKLGILATLVLVVSAASCENKPTKPLAPTAGEARSRAEARASQTFAVEAGQQGDLRDERAGRKIVGEVKIPPQASSI